MLGVTHPTRFTPANEVGSTEKQQGVEPIINRTEQIIEYVTVPRDVNESAWKKTKKILASNPSQAMLVALRTIEDVKGLVISGDPDGSIN